MKEVVDFEGALAGTSLMAATPGDTSAAPSATASPTRSLPRSWGADRNRRAQPPQGARRARRVQPRGYLRRRVRKLHAVSLLQLRKRVRSRSGRPQEGHDSGQRPQPHRPGHRVRLLLLPRLVRAAGDGRRVDHGQLQPGDRLDRLRHQRPPLLRAAHARKRAQHLRHGEARRRDRAVRRADAAEPGAAAEAAGRSDHRHRSREHRSGRGPQAVRQAARRPGDSLPRQRHRHQRGGGLRGGAPASATRCWCGPATCWAGAPW